MVKSCLQQGFLSLSTNKRKEWAVFPGGFRLCTRFVPLFCHPVHFISSPRGYQDQATLSLRYRKNSNMVCVPPLSDLLLIAVALALYKL